MENLLEVDHLWKKYSRDLKASVRFATKELLKSTLGRTSEKRELRDTEFWALRNINFQLRRGEVLAIVGHNGAGKSTLLKCIAGKLQADKGNVAVKGEIGYLLEMSAGFNPRMSGRENVSIRGRLLGMRGKELDRYVDQVCEFAELEEFFDAPVQFYSSGMKSRLGFSASSVIEPDILIIDEVLAVGDLAFRLKCYERINDMARNAAVLFVSHSIGQIARLCSRGIYLEKGRAIYDGDVQGAISKYQEHLTTHSGGNKSQTLNPDLVSFSVISNGRYIKEGDSIEYGASLSLEIDVSKLSAGVQVRVVLKDASQMVLLDWNSARAELSWPSSHALLYADLGSVELAPGNYSIYLQIMSGDGMDHLCLSEAVVFQVSGKYYYAVSVQKSANWKFINTSVAELG
ncbi:polysaccharide ABC transporter ATP-binding protein [Hahella ganghwensis]|uniref:ABC transporter ATP-binding protein n=1 Tax=Hahella ganghwensis TaxID=286420 RepID=UPI00036AA5A2|nr:polysaccharide ABC transporter ATP-binding protein [Hahella ganghwensis]